MKKYWLIAAFLSINTSLMAETYPCLTVINNTPSNLYLKNQQWSQQQVVVHGEVTDYLDSSVEPAKSLTVCGLWNEFGLNLDSNGSTAAVTIANDGGTKLTQLLDVSSLSSIHYQVITQTANQLTLKINPS